VMTSPGNKSHFSTIESVAPPDIFVPNMPPLRPTLHQSSGPTLVYGSAGWDVISSLYVRLRTSPMFAERVQEQRYGSGNRDPM
jgi:hypothetical protein